MKLFNTAKPFLKWAGGKSQLISDIKQRIPKSFIQKDFIYIEPFVGSGAVLFWLLNNFYNLKQVVINDINENLINTYQTIASNAMELISVLEIFQNEFHQLTDNDLKKEYYYQKRTLYNSDKENKIVQSALFIFLNKTCFNGLYRVNKKNEFNVPIGSYKKPLICDKENILVVSKALEKVEILCGDFEQTLDYAGENTLFYFDPPYKPLSDTSNFNSYASVEFGDAEQVRLRDFCTKLDKLKHSWILSNSAPDNNFFNELYNQFNINQVQAKRSINTNAEKRGKITELLIDNYMSNKTIVTI